METTVSGSFTQRKGEVRIYTHDLTDALAKTWERGRVLALSYTVRPSRSTGLQYRVTTAGQTGNTEPRWPVVSGGTIVDGTVTWTAEAVTDASLLAYIAASGDSVWTADGNATVTGSLPRSTTTTGLIDTTASAVGQTCRIVNRVTLTNGEKVDAIFNIEVVD